MVSGDMEEKTSSLENTIAIKDDIMTAMHKYIRARSIRCVILFPLVSLCSGLSLAILSLCMFLEITVIINMIEAPVRNHMLFIVNQSHISNPPLRDATAIIT